MRPALSLIAVIPALGVGCGEEEPLHPVPTAAQLAETTLLVDKVGAHPDGPLGEPMWKFGNVGKPSSTVYLDDGTRLKMYRKPGSAVKTGGVLFDEVRLSFDRAEKLQLFEANREPATAAECDLVLAKMKDMYGLGYPYTEGRLRWIGTSIRAEWSYQQTRRGGRCLTVWRTHAVH